MNNLKTPTAAALRYSYEFLSLLNLILAAIYFLIAKDKTFLDPTLIRGKLTINGLLHLHPHSDVGSSVTLFSLAALGASVFWVVLRMFSKRLSSSQTFHFLFGAIDLVAAPMAWMYVFQFRWFPLSLEQVRFLPIGFASVVIFAALYLNRRQTLPIWVMLAAIGGHYALWFWIFWESAGPSILMMLVTGLCASLLWTISVRQQRISPHAGPAICTF